MQHDRMVVGEQHLGHQRRGHAGLGCRDVQADLGAVRVDRRRARAGRPPAARARASRGCRSSGRCASAGSPTPSSRTTSNAPPAPSDVSDSDTRVALGMADDVGQALLRDAIDDELLLGSQRQVSLEVALDLDARSFSRSVHNASSALCRPSSSSASGRRRRAITRTSSAAWPRCLPQALQIGSELLRGAPGQRLAAQQQPGQQLADLVVQLARDAAALGLLRRQRTPAALAPLALEPVEHVVERLGQRRHLLAGRIDRHPLTRLQRVDRAHHRREPLERSERPVQQDPIRQQHRDEPRQDDPELLGRRRDRHRDRRQHQRGRREREDERVADEQPAKQRRAAHA